MTPFSFKKHNATRMARSAKVMKRLLGTRSTKSPQPETREKSKVMREFPKRPAPLLPTKPAEKVKKKRKTKKERKPPHPLVQEFIDAINVKREEARREAYAEADKQHDEMSAEMTSLTQTIMMRQELIMEVDQFLAKNPADEVLDFIRKDGVKKGSATLGSRMDLFKEKQAELKGAIEELWAEWDATQQEIAEVTAELKVYVEDESFEERTREKEKRFVERVDSLCDKMVKKMAESEKKLNVRSSHKKKSFMALMDKY